MTLIELRYIVLLAETQHFGRAAELCHVSQPTLSIAIKKVEDELGVNLFERTKSRVRITELGVRIAAQAKRVLEQVAVLQDIADAGKDQFSSPLAVGAIFTLGPYLLPQLIPYLQQQAPRMSLYIEEDFLDNLRKKLCNGALDVIVVSLPFNEPDVVTQVLFDEPFVVLMPAAHPLASKPEITAADIDPQQLLLLGEGHCFREQLLATSRPWRRVIGEAAGQQLRRAEANTLETLRYMVAAGLGITIVPQSAATPALTELQVVARPYVGASRTLALAWRASFPRHAVISLLRTAIQTCSGAYWRFTTEQPDAEQSILSLRDY